MKGKTITIIQKFDSTHDYGIPIRPQVRKVLSQLEPNKEYALSKLIKKYDGIVTKKKNIQNTRGVFKHVMNTGKQIGIIKEINDTVIPFSDFCNLDTVSYMRRQLKETKFKNPKAKTRHSGGGTRRSYSLHIWHFNNWLCGKTITTQTITPLGNNTQKITTAKIKINTIEDLLRIYQTSVTKGPEFLRIIKEYLMNDLHKNKSEGYMRIITSAIKSYFEKNESPITIHFNPSVDHDNDSVAPSLSLDELMQLLTTGKPSVVQKGVIMCKFHTGLDNATFADRFNFEAWPQLVKWFGTRDYSDWDLRKCPVIINITRIKVGFLHICLLEQDAIIALQKALDWRFKKTKTAMSEGQAIFLNTGANPITDRWVSELIPKLAEKAEIQKKIRTKSGNRNEKVSHELRDLLKSTLRACGVASYAANHVIGHVPQDSYEKEQILYPEKIRYEYMKASKLLNIFTKFSSIIKGTDDVDVLKGELADALAKLESQDASKELVEYKNKVDQLWAERDRLEHILEESVKLG